MDIEAAYKGGFPRLYHVTTKEIAAKILLEGFRDGESRHPFTGVLLSNTPLTADSGAYGDCVLIVQFHIPLHRLRRFEIIEEGKTYREWLIPSAFIAKHAVIRIRQ